MCLVPVLITAPPDDALPIVQTIAAHERRGRIREIVSCDAAAGGDVIEAITDNRMRIGTDIRTAILWVAGVHALTPRDQFALMKLLAYPGAGRGGVSRISHRHQLIFATPSLSRAARSIALSSPLGSLTDSIGSDSAAMMRRRLDSFLALP